MELLATLVYARIGRVLEQYISKTSAFVKAPHDVIAYLILFRHTILKCVTQISSQEQILF